MEFAGLASAGDFEFKQLVGSSITGYLGADSSGEAHCLDHPLALLSIRKYSFGLRHGLILQWLNDSDMFFRGTLNNPQLRTTPMSLDLAKIPPSDSPIHLLDEIQVDSNLPGLWTGLDAPDDEMKTEVGKSPGGAMMLAIGAKFDSTLTQSGAASWLDLPASIWHQQAVSQIMQSIQTACETVFPLCKGKLILSVRIEIGENWGKLWAALDLGKLPSELFPSMQMIARAVSLEMYNPTDKKQAQTFGRSDPSLRDQESEDGVSPQQPGGADSTVSDSTLPDHLLDVWNLVDAKEGDGQRAAVLEKVMGRDKEYRKTQDRDITNHKVKNEKFGLLLKGGTTHWMGTPRLPKSEGGSAT